MGVVKKQGIANSIWIYIGLALGYINMGFIMAKILSTENFGLRTVLFQAGDFFSVIALIGLPNIVNRFFPSFMNKEKGHGGILSFILFYWLFGIALASVILLLSKGWVVDYYADKSQLLVDFYLFIIPFGGALALFEGLTAYSKALLKTTVPVFIREVGQRILTTFLLGLLAVDIIEFDDFMTWYLGSYVLATAVLIIYLIKLDEFQLKLTGGFAWIGRLKEMIVFGLYTWFNNAMQRLVKTADALMLSYFTGLGAAGIYGLGALIGNIVQVPSQSLRQIAAPLISRHFEENNIAEIGKLYAKTCMVQLVSGLFIYLVILVNLDVIFTIWRPEFAAGKAVIIYLGAARLVAGSTGLNGRIIVESKYFRWNFYFNMIMGVLAITTNLLLIPKYGILGASIASSLTIVTVSALKVLFVYVKFGLQPFSSKTLIALGIGLLAYFAGAYLPMTDVFFADIVLKSLVFCLLFVPLVIKANISEEVNDLVYNGFKKARNLLKRS